MARDDYTLDSYNDEFRTSYEQAPYFKAGQTWDDYEPAYKYSYDQFTGGEIGGRSFEDVESDLARGWEKSKAKSRLAWEDAKAAVKAGWERLEQAMPGDSDRDGH